MGDDDMELCQVRIRMRRKEKNELKKAALENNRSLNAEIMVRIKKSRYVEDQDRQ